MTGRNNLDNLNNFSTRPGNYITEYYDNWTKTTPFISRTIVLVVLSIWVLSWFINFYVIFGNNLLYTLFYIQIYRWLLSSFVGDGIVTLSFFLVYFPNLSSRLENAYGSSTFLTLICCLSAISNIIYSIISLFAWISGISYALYWTNSGIWNIVFGLLVIESFIVSYLNLFALFLPKIIQFNAL